MDNHKMLTFGIALLIVVVARLLYDRKQLMDPLGHKHFEFYVRSGRNTHEYTRHILHVGGLNSAARRCKFCREERRKELVSLPNKPYEDFVQEASVIETKQSNENYLLYNRKQLMDPLGHKHIEIIQNVNDCERIVNVLKCHCQTIKVLGFDCEWVTFGSRTWPVALLQLSSSKGLCALFRLCSMKQIPKSLRDLLEDDEVVKVGVDPSGDAKKLWCDYGVGVASTYDLRFLAATTGTKPEGLARMSQSVLNVVLDKNWRLACSNWEAKELTDEQLDYAANDALVAVEIFKKLSSHLDPKNLLSKLDFESIRLRIEPFLEVSYQEGYLTNVKKSKKNKNSAGLGALEDRYLSYNLETWVEPAGVCDHNQCEVCGYNEAYIRKHVVPREYRKHFPVVMKTHSSHNGFLLCQPCHKISKMSDLHIRHKLAKLCNAPFTHEDRYGKFKEISELSYKLTRGRMIATVYKTDALIPPQ